MKKFYLLPVFILTGIIFQFSSCDEKTYTVTIKNESSRLVSYVYNDKEDYLGKEAGVDNSKQYLVGSYTPAPKDIKVIRESDGDFDNETMTIRMEKHEENIYTFKNSDVLVLSVLNTLPVDVVLKNEKYIDFNGSTEMTIPAYGQEEGKLYTSTVNFTLYPSQYRIDFNFNEERTAISVTIRE